MAFVGNDIFGNGMTHHPSTLAHAGGGFGNSHGTGGFGSSASKSTFGQGMGGFGHSMSGGHASISQNQFFHRQNSLLTDMTHSKTDPKPVYVSQFNQSQAVHEGHMFSNMYDKPLEKPKPKPVLKKRPTLTRQSSVSIPDDFDRPPKLSLRTRSQSVSLYPTDDEHPPLKPMNMDVATPILRRSNTVSAKPEKGHKHKFLRPLSLGHKFRKRSDSRSSQSSTEPSRSEPPKSMKYREAIENRETPTKSRSSELPLSPKTAKEQEALILSLMNPHVSTDIETDYTDSPDRYDHHQYTGKQFLLQPVAAAGHQVLGKHNPSPEEVTESPTTIRRRFQQPKPTDHDDISLTSGRSTPKSVHVISTPSSFRSLTIETPARKAHSKRDINNQSPRGASEPKTFNDYKPDVVGKGKHPTRSDSDNSDIFYDCEISAENKKNSRRDNRPDRKRGKRKPQAEKVVSSRVSTGTCSDDESSDRNSPRVIKKSSSPFNHPYENLEYVLHQEGKSKNEIDDSTLHVRELIDTFNRKAKQNAVSDTPPSPTLTHVKPEVRDLVAALSFAQHLGESDHEEEIVPIHDTIATSPPQIIIPKFDTVPKGQEPCTADSSESGYTSNLQNSPREFELKAAHYVNSLPSNKELENRKSTSSDLLRNGSQTESDNESEISENHCRSGSDSDYHMSDDESVTKLEVAKLLESPSEIEQRINHQIMKQRKESEAKQFSENRSPTEIKQTSLQILHSPNSPFIEKIPVKYSNSNRQKCHDSMTEIKHSNTAEFKSTNMVPETKPSGHVKIDTVVVDTARPGSMRASSETRQHSHKKSSSFAADLLNLPLLGFRKRELSSVAQSSFTNCLDNVLHILNVIVFATSAGIVAVGMWLLLKDFNINNICEIFGNNMIQVIVYVSILGAALALLATMCLCCGIRRDKFGLGFYATALVFVVFAFACTAVLCTIFADQLRGVASKINFKDRLTTRYGNIKGSPVENKYFTDSWDKMQQRFECCGAYGNVNDTTSWAVYKKFSIWFREKIDNKAFEFVPESCCAANLNTKVCMGSDHHLLGPPVYGPPMERGFNTKNRNLNTDGCYSAISSYLQQFLAITALVTGGLAALYFIVIMLTWVFCFKRRQDGDYEYSSYEYEDDVFDDEDDEEGGEEANEESAIHNIHNETEVNHSVSIHRLPSQKSSDLKASLDSDETDMNVNKTWTDPNYPDAFMEELDRMSPVSEGEAIDRRDRYERSDTKLHLLFTETIEEEDSNFEDSDIEEEHNKF